MGTTYTKKSGNSVAISKPMLDKQTTERNDLCGRISEIDPPCQIILEMCNAAAKPDFWERCFFVFEKYSCKDLRSCLRHLNHRTKRVMFIMMVIMWWWYRIWDWISRLMLRRFVHIKEWCCINTKRKLKMMSKFMARTKFKYCALWEHHPMPYFANMSQML